MAMMTSVDLYQCSLEIIRANQYPNGAYVACPNFPNYRYCWLRDGAFTAYAMDLSGEPASAARFHDWATGVINARRDLVQAAVERARAGQPVRTDGYLHTRFTFDGFEAVLPSHEEPWPNYQLDGFGAWLWSLGQHCRLSGEPLPATWAEAANLTVDYLTALWQQPCYDCWEEFPDQIHTHTLAAIYGGLQAAAQFLERDLSAPLQAIRSFVETRCTSGDHFVKYAGSTVVDASLLGLAIPYRLVAVDDARMVATVREIEQHLVRLGGVHRYAEDTYYGGGEWILLACWLAWYYVEAGNLKRANALFQWVESQADANGHLPEQVPGSLNDPAFLPHWEKKWGPSATPLVWSHAKYLILRHIIAAAQR